MNHTLMQFMKLLYLIDFLRFDEIAGDETIVRPPRTSRTQEIFSASLSLPTPVLVYGQPHQDIHVSNPDLYT